MATWYHKVQGPQSYKVKLFDSRIIWRHVDHIQSPDVDTDCD